MFGGKNNTEVTPMLIALWTFLAQYGGGGNGGAGSGGGYGGSGGYSTGYCIVVGITAPRVIAADVLIVGAGPTRLMLAVELGLAGVRALVLERLPHPSEIKKAGGLSGQILELLRYRGLLERFEAASTGLRPAPRLPWGGMHVDFTPLADPPMQVMPLPQPLLERL